jgi:N-acetylneuraminic acid mutarotase
VNTKEWTWENGSNQAGAASVYGTEGVASSANVPGGRSGAISWIDSSGNLWLFGSGSYDVLGATGPSNDLWEYSPASKEWTWMSGSSSAPGNKLGVYGTEGTAASTNVPGGRSSAVSWIDGSGNLWLFGGDGYDSTGQNYLLNDLWEFNPSTKQRTWVSGSNLVLGKAIYGALGVAAASNVPGARERAVSWRDHSGNFWLSGGDGLDANGVWGFFNDLWEFNPTSKEWTWVSGSSTVSGVAPGALCMAGVYGTEGTNAAANIPGGRNAAVSWLDTSGNLWLFGGLGCDSSGTAGSLNDLWEFNTTSKTWTWQSGGNSVGPAQGGTGGPSGVYGTEGTAATGNVPGGRSSSVSWIDSSGNLWLFGGVGHDSTGASGNLNDLWSYTP